MLLASLARTLRDTTVEPFFHGFPLRRACNVPVTESVAGWSDVAVVSESILELFNPYPILVSVPPPIFCIQPLTILPLLSVILIRPVIFVSSVGVTQNVLDAGSS